MKKIVFLTVLTLLLTLLGAATWRVDLEDSYGDGWNGGVLTVFVNGTAVLEDITLDDGSGPQSFFFGVQNGDEITTDYTEGSWSSENEYYIYNHEGVLQAAMGASGTIPEDIIVPIVAEVPEATEPPEPTTAVSPLPGDEGAMINATLNWAAASGLPTGYKLSLGTDNPPTNILDAQDVGDVTTYDPSPLSYGTTYYWQITPYNDNGDALNCPVWSFTTMADPTVTTFPFNEGFEDAWVGSPSAPLGWSQISVSGTNVWNRNGYSSHSGTYNAQAPWASAGGEHLLITPPLDFGSGAYRLKFWLKGSSSPGTELFVELGSNNSSAADFTEPLAWFAPGNNMPTSWTEISIDLSSYSGINFIAFRMVDDNGYSLYIDDVLVEAIPVAPIFSYSPASIDFGNVVVGSSSDWQNVTITNIGGGTLELPLAAVNIIGEFQDLFEFDPTNFPFSLEAGQSGLIPVRFNPADTSFYDDAALQITYGDGKAVYEIPLTGTGVTPFVNMTNGSTELLEWESWNFYDSGGIGANYSSYEDYTYTFTAVEGYRVKVEFSAFNTESGYDYLKIYDGEDATGTLIGNYAGSTLPPSYSASETGSLTFVFTSDSGVQYSGWEATVTAEEIPANPIFAVDPESWAFGDVDINGPAASKTFTISNVGAGTLEVTGVDVTGEYYYMGDAPEFPQFLTLGDTAEFTVHFGPEMVGPFDGLITINTTEGGKSKAAHTVELTGSGYDPVISVFPWVEDFGSASTDWPVQEWTQFSGLYPTPTSTTAQWFQDDWLNVTTPLNKAAKLNVYGSSRYGWLVTPGINIPEAEHQLTFDAGLVVWNGTSSPTTTQADDRFMVIMSDSPDMTDPTILREWNNTGSPHVFNMIPATGKNYKIVLTGISGIKYFAFYGESTVSGNGDNDLMIDNVKIETRTYDVPLNTPTEVATGVELESDIDLDINETIDETNDAVVSLPNYDDMVDPIVIGLTGTGVTDLVFTVGAGTWYGTLYVGGTWYQGNPYPLVGPGTITFAGVDFDAKGDVIVVLSEGSDPTLPVELSSFTAVLTGDMYVQIAWVAESETNHSGYNILRSESMDMAEAIKVNAALIEEGSNLGSQISYSFIDSEAYINMQYYYWLESVALDGVVSHYGPLTVTIGDPELDPVAPTIPKVTTLHNAFPNPFNPSTTIGYYMAEGGNVDIQIYNLRGQLMKSYTATHADQGTYYMSWDGRDTNGQPVGSGIYLYRMTSGNYSSTKKMVLSK